MSNQQKMEFSLPPWLQGSRLAKRGLLTDPQSLNSEEKILVERYLNQSVSNSPNKFVLVGVFRGEEIWDKRLLLLNTASLNTTSERGTLSLLRFSHPELSPYSDRYKLLKRELSYLVGSPSRHGVLEYGETTSQLWMRRHFFQYCGHALLESKSITLTLGLFQNLTLLVSQLHQQGIIHGHICIQNLAMDQGVTFLLDHGFFALGNPQPKMREDVAPEIKLGEGPSFASDVFGLGQVALLTQEITHWGSKSSLVQSMLAKTPEDRPTVWEINQDLLKSPSSTSHLSGQGSSWISTGKVLNFWEAQSAVDPVSTTKPLKTYPVDFLNLPQPAKNLGPYFLIGGILLLLVYYFYTNEFFAKTDNNNTNQALDYEFLWKSGIPSKMKVVAKTASLSRDETARAIIIKDIIEGSNPPLVRSQLLRTAFHPLWKAELQESDKDLLFTLALLPFLAEDKVLLPPLEKAHPGAILAVAGDLGLTASEGEFTRIPIQKLIQLPPPYGTAFKELARLGVTNLSELSARALSHLMMGDVSSESIIAYFAKENSLQVFLAKLLIVLPFTELYPSLADNLSSLMVARGDILAKRIQWFESEAVANWKDVKTKDKLFLCAAFMPELPLSIEQYSDLLKFPSEIVRKETVKRLIKSFPGLASEQSIRFLASKENAFSRQQVVSLVLALRTEGEASYSFLSRWFDTDPDPKSVLGVLLARNQVPKLDPFNVEASRFLKTKDLKISFDGIKILSTHPEPIARAIAYAKLDPDNPEERALLEERLRNEPSEKMKAAIARKLEGLVEEIE